MVIIDDIMRWAAVVIIGLPALLVALVLGSMILAAIGFFIGLIFVTVGAIF